MDRTVITNTECVVIGGGTAGCMAAATASDTRDVTLLNKGAGASYWSSGCIDVIGRVGGHYVESPSEGIQMLVEANPAHPYSVISRSDQHAAVKVVDHALERFKSLTSYSYEGSLKRNVWVITSLGTIRPTCLVPTTVLRGSIGELRDAKTSLVGFRGFTDFDPRYVVVLLRVNMQAYGLDPLDITAKHVTIGGKTTVQPSEISEYIKTDDGFARLCNDVAALSKGCSHVGVPSVFDREATERLQQLGEVLGVTTFEVPMPFSLVGHRLRELLSSNVERVEVVEGIRVQELAFADGLCTAARAKRWAFGANSFILATGGVLSGGVGIDDGHMDERLTGWRIGKVHGVPRSAGLHVNNALNPLLPSAVKNLFACGSLLGNYDPVSELSGHGVCIATGYVAGRRAARYGR
ncbi:MAG: FAD-binding protein [Halobacteriota archaeon]